MMVGGAGNTDTSAPLSTRKERRRRGQKMERAPSREVEEDKVEMMGEEPGVLNDPRLCRFPRPLREMELVGA